MRKICASAAVAVMAVTAASAAEPDKSAGVVSEWCDTPAGEIVIQREPTGRLTVTTTMLPDDFKDQQAVRRDGDVFRVFYPEGLSVTKPNGEVVVLAERGSDSRHGDGFRILPNGDLELFDKEGRIRVAAKKRSACKRWADRMRSAMP